MTYAQGLAQASHESSPGETNPYSLGCVLYELLTGQPPFTGDAPLAVAYKHMNEEPTPPSRLDPVIPKEVEADTGRSLGSRPHPICGSRCAWISRQSGHWRRQPSRPPRCPVPRAEPYRRSNTQCPFTIAV